MVATTGDWYLIHTGDRSTMVIGAGCRGEDIVMAARDWLRRGGVVTVNGPDRGEFVSRLLSTAGGAKYTVDGTAGSLNVAPLPLSDTA